MNHSQGIFAAAILAAFTMLPGCRSARSSNVELGTRYTQFTMHVDRDLYRSTNYRRGVVVPVNTQVEIESQRGRVVNLVIAETGRKFRFEHMRKHTRDAIEDAVAQAFGREPVDLSGFAPEMQEAIKSGKATEGMSKSEVLLTMGPPPASGTESLDGDEWRYWDSRVTSFFVRFDQDGRVSETRSRR